MTRWEQNVYNCAKGELWCECRMTWSPWKLGVIISSVQFIFHSGFILALFTLIIEVAEKLILFHLHVAHSPDICHILLQNYFNLQLFDFRCHRKEVLKYSCGNGPTTITVTIHNDILCTVLRTYEFNVYPLFSKGIWEY